MIAPLNLPASVVRGTACAVCWRPLGNGTFYVQTLDEARRHLCPGCCTRFFPVTLPSGEQPNVIHAQPDRSGWVAMSCRLCGKTVEGPLGGDPICIGCALSEAGIVVDSGHFETHSSSPSDQESPR